MRYELVKYDLMGAAWRDGHIVDAHAIVDVEVVLHPETPEEADAPRSLDPLILPHILVSSLSEEDRTALYAAWETVESIIERAARTTHAALVASPKMIDERISAATRADEARKEAEAAATRAEQRARAAEAKAAAAEAAATRRLAEVTQLEARATVAKATKPVQG